MYQLMRNVFNMTRKFFESSIKGHHTTLTKNHTYLWTARTPWNLERSNIVPNLISQSRNVLQGLSGLQFSRGKISLCQMHRRGPLIKKRKKPRPLGGNPFLKGVVLKTLIKKPVKPNSANRKCILVRLSNGKEMVAYVPGIGHNLQEHNIVLCRVGRVKDLVGVKIKCVRGKYDLPHVIKQKQ